MRNHAPRIVRGVGIMLLLTRAASAQSDPDVPVSGSVPTPLTLTASDLAAMPRSTVTMSNNGIQTVYEGVMLHEILKKAGMRLGEALRGPALATYVLASASDGYQVLFSLGELDP